MTILPPPKIYLDTNHLVEISKLRKGKAVRQGAQAAYETIDSCLLERHFGLVFQPGGPLEWVDGHATLGSALEIAAVVDSAKLVYDWEIDSFVFLHEVLAELKRLQPDFVPPEFEIMHCRLEGRATRRPLPVLRNEIPDYFLPGELASNEECPSEIPDGTAAEWVRRMYKLKHDRPSVYQERVDGFRAATMKSLALFENSGRKPCTKAVCIEWMKRYLRLEKVLAARAPTADIDNLLAKVDLANCPAVDLYMKALDQRLRSGHAPKDNDVDDWLFLPVVPYVDVMLTERSLCHFIRQADISLGKRVCHDPKQAVKLLHKWL